MHALAFNIVFHIGGIVVICQHALCVNVGNSRIAALRFACRPAGDFEAFKPHFRRSVYGLFK